MTEQETFFQQEVGGEACEDKLAALYLPRFVALPLDGEAEVGRLATLATRNLAAIHFILPVDIAVHAPGAYLGAAVPRIPVSVYLPMFGHLPSPTPMFLLRSLVWRNKQAFRTTSSGRSW